MLHQIDSMFTRAKIALRREIAVSFTDADVRYWQSQLAELEAAEADFYESIKPLSVALQEKIDATAATVKSSFLLEEATEEVW